MKIKIPEAVVKKSIMDYLEIQEKLGRCYVVRNNSISGVVLRPNGSRGYVHNSKKGTPDLIVCVAGGRFVGIEVKSSEGKQSKEQKDTQAFLEKLGATYILATSIADVESLFSHTNIPPASSAFVWCQRRDSKISKLICDNMKQDRMRRRCKNCKEVL